MGPGLVFSMVPNMSKSTGICGVFGATQEVARPKTLIFKGIGVASPLIEIARSVR